MARESENIKKQERKAKSKEAKKVDEKSKVYGFVASENWVVIKKKLIDKIVALDSIINVPDDKVTRQDILANRRAVVILYQFLGEIEGDVQEYLMYLNIHPENKKEQVILNLEEDDEE